MRLPKIQPVWKKGADGTYSEYEEQGDMQELVAAPRGMYVCVCVCVCVCMYKMYVCMYVFFNILLSISMLHYMVILHAFSLSTHSMVTYIYNLCTVSSIFYIHFL